MAKEISTCLCAKCQKEEGAVTIQLCGNIMKDANLQADINLIHGSYYDEMA